MAFTKRRIHPVQQLAFMLAGAAFVFGCISALGIAEVIEKKYFPIRDQITASAVVIEDDVFVAGSFRKIRDCGYIPPVRAVDDQGRNLYVISHSPTSGNSWQPSTTPQMYGPWQIVNGAGRRIKVYHEYECHPLWNQHDSMMLLDTSVNPIKITVAR